MGHAGQARLEPLVSDRRYDGLRAAPSLHRSTLEAAVQGLASASPRPLRTPVRLPLAGQLRSPGRRGGEEFTGPHTLAEALELPPGCALREAQVLDQSLGPLARMTAGYALRPLPVIP